jgi:hypothetical protein
MDDTGGHERVSHLQQHGRPAAEERYERRVAHPTDDTLGREVSVSARHPLRVRRDAGAIGAKLLELGHADRVPVAYDRGCERS